AARWPRSSPRRPTRSSGCSRRPHSHRRSPKAVAPRDEVRGQTSLPPPAPRSPQQQATAHRASHGEDQSERCRREPFPALALGRVYRQNISEQGCSEMSSVLPSYRVAGRSVVTAVRTAAFLAAFRLAFFFAAFFFGRSEARR